MTNLEPAAVQAPLPAPIHAPHPAPLPAPIPAPLPAPIPAQAPIVQHTLPAPIARSAVKGIAVAPVEETVVEVPVQRAFRYTVGVDHLAAGPAVPLAAPAPIHTGQIIQQAVEEY